MTTDEQWWQEVADNELAAADAEAREALQWLVAYLGSAAEAARFLRVDPRLVGRNLKRIAAHRRLSKRMLLAVRGRLQIIPRRRSDNVVERMAWTVENLREQAQEQRRTNIELRDRLRELELLAQGPPVRWQTEMERMQRQVRKQLGESKELLDLTSELAKSVLETYERLRQDGTP